MYNRTFTICLLCAFTTAVQAANLPISNGTANTLRATLSNGLTVVIVPDHLAPVVALELNYLVGSNDSPPGFPGMAHALEHMMFRGSSGLDRDQSNELAALLGGQYNADTTETVTQYTHTIPVGDLDTALRIEASRMRSLTLSQVDWEQERGAIEQEVSRDLSSPLYTYMSYIQSIMFAGTPYEHDALGTRLSFDQTDATLIRSFYEQWYVPNNAILVLVGDVDPEVVLEQVRVIFADIPRRVAPAHVAFSLASLSAQTLTLPTNLPTGFVSLAYRMPGIQDADFAAADVLSDILGSQRGPLYALVTAGRTAMTRFMYEPKASVGFGLELAEFPKGDDPAPLLAELRNAFADIAKNGLSSELVEAAKQQEMAQLAFENDSISGLAHSWSKALAFRGATSMEDVANAYANVTLADVNRLASTLFDPDHTITTILTSENSSVAIKEGGFGGRESFSTLPSSPVILPDWAKSALVDFRLPSAKSSPDVSILPNGLRLIVESEHINHTVSVYGRIRQIPQMQEPLGKEGLASLTEEMFSYGTQKKSQSDLRKSIDDIAAIENSGINFSLKVLVSQFEAGMKLLAEHELQPIFLTNQFDIARRQLARHQADLLTTPDYLFERATQHAILPEGDPMLREATPETIMALQPADVQAYYATAYRPDLTTIVIIGDVTPEEARRSVVETFGDWKNIGTVPNINLPPLGVNSLTAVRIQDRNSKQDSVRLLQTIQLPVDSSDRYALSLGNIILGNGYFSHLHRDLREHTGYVYSVSSNIDWSRTRAYYVTSFGVDLQNVDRACDLIRHDIHDMQENAINDTELASVKAQVLRRLSMQRASVEAIAALYLRLVDLNLPLDQGDIAAKQFLEVTASDIQRAFITWLRPDDLALVEKGPPLPR